MLSWKRSSRHQTWTVVGKKLGRARADVPKALYTPSFVERISKLPTNSTSCRLTIAALEPTVMKTAAVL